MSRSSMVERSTDNRKMIVQFYPGQPKEREDGRYRRQRI